MFYSHWLRNVLAVSRSRKDRRRTVGRRRKPVRPILESLEDRRVLTTITDLGALPNYQFAAVSGINASGQVAGDGEPTGSPYYHAFLSSNGQTTDLGTLPGDVGSFATGINASGQVAGYSENDPTGSVSHAFLYSNGQMTNLGTLSGDTGSEALGLNDSGQVVGESYTGSTSQAFLYSNGQMTSLGTLPGDTNSSAQGISSTGLVVGYSSSSIALSTYRAFLYNNGQMTSLGTLPGDDGSSAFRVNDSGQVVGESFTTGQNPLFHAFLYSNGQMTSLGALPGDTNSVATGINDSGQVVGESYVNPTTDHPFLYNNGQMIDLNSLLPANSGWTLTQVTGISDSGQVFGTGTINGQTDAFILNLDLVSLSPATLPAGLTNTAYSQTITASGGTGDKTLTYTITSGAIPAGLTFTPSANELSITGTPTASGTVTFSVTAKDSAASPDSTTQTYTLTVNAPVAPSITGNPSNQTVAAGQNATFTATASGNPTPTVQWQISVDSGKTFDNLPGATSTTLTLPNTVTSLNGAEVRAVFTNSAGSVNSNAATITITANVGTAPAITSGNGAIFSIGQGGGFTVTATGSPTPILTESGALPSGVTFTNNGNGTATLRGDPTVAGTYHFTITAQNGLGSTTQSFTLTVNPAPPQVPPLLGFISSLPFFTVTEKANPDGTTTVTDTIFGFPLLVSIFNSSTGHFEDATLFGFDITFLIDLLG